MVVLMVRVIVRVIVRVTVMVILRVRVSYVTFTVESSDCKVLSLAYYGLEWGYALTAKSSRWPKLWLK